MTVCVIDTSVITGPYIWENTTRVTVSEDNRKLIRRNNNRKLEGHWKRVSGETIKRKLGYATIGENDTSDIGSELGKGNMSDEQERIKPISAQTDIWRHYGGSGTPRSDTSCHQKAEFYVRIQLHSNGTTWRQRTIATLVAGRYA